ncbi:MAG: hypothetical protein COT32_01905 [Candidatus Nealsonbacteria bacterium CG08_land_8_20_14_0_20_36_22]|uniref:Spore protein YkvP/CgeB glycosyl transferase-like domain-containing protein n=1 Tax=Candidatus Nealsonbacteria bacterium CG08_land_8_20_14_0_20_36_22 TaxID=1974704 RepID=A0A2H0YNH6_9BACT|nr:MAG: hypothetical protein COT32_01905 [Candidatus Nealsonbacteria bacterium CG08_land_8_20_14_0_20_36_22]
MFLKLKIFLKKSLLIFWVNAFIKVSLNSWRLKRLYRHYQSQAVRKGIKYNESEIVNQVRDRLVARGVQIKPLPRGKLRIFYVGSHYEQDVSGFLQALKNFGGEVIPLINDYNGYNPNRWVPVPRLGKLAIPQVGEDLLRQVKKAHQQKPLNVLIGQMWADMFHPDVLKNIQALGIPVINIMMDDTYVFHWSKYKGRRLGSVGLVGGLDLVLTTFSDACLWYAIEGCPAIYWPLASSPDFFYPRREKIYDVVFVGSNMGFREQLVKKILKAGIKIEAFGPGFPNGFIKAEKISEVFGKAKIVLGISYIGYNKDVMGLKLRDFDALMSGALCITTRNPDLLKLFEEGKEIECYDTIDECITKIRFYLANPDKLKAVAEAGLKKARENYTWEKNIEKALKFIGLID